MVAHTNSEIVSEPWGRIVNGIGVACRAESQQTPSLQSYSPQLELAVGFQAKKVDRRALTLIRLPNLTSRCPWSCFQECIFCRPRAVAVETQFPSVTEP